MRRMPLLLQLFAIYLLAILLGTMLLIAKNIWVHSLSWADLAEYFFGAVAAFNLIFLLLMQAISYVRLRGVHRYFADKAAKGMSPEKLLSRLFRFPSELFWGMIALSALLSVCYHALSRVVRGPIETWRDWMGSMLSEMALAVTLSVLVYSLLRSALRPYLQQLQQTKIAASSRTSAIRPIMLCFVSCFVIISFDALRIVLAAAAQGAAVNVAAMSSIVFVDFLFSFCVLTVLIRGLRNELRDMVNGIESLSSGRRTQLHDAIQIGFPDELGQLADAFNAEQERAARRYDLLEEERRLALSVQQMLLAEREFQMGSFHVLAEGRSAKAAGEWYDILPLEPSRFAVIVGHVEGRDMPAALIMSAALVLLRSEIRQNGAPDEALRHLRDEWENKLPASMRVHLGIALIDTVTHHARIAVLGVLHAGWQRGAKGSGAWQPIFTGQPPDDDLRTCAMTFAADDRLRLAIEARSPDALLAGGAAVQHTRVTIHYRNQ